MSYSRPCQDKPRGCLPSLSKRDCGVIDVDGRTTHHHATFTGLRCPRCSTRSLENLVIKCRRSPRRRGSANISVKHCPLCKWRHTRDVVILAHHHHVSVCAIHQEAERTMPASRNRSLSPITKKNVARNVKIPTTLARKEYVLLCAVTAIMGVGARLLCASYARINSVASIPSIIGKESFICGVTGTVIGLL